MEPSKLGTKAYWDTVYAQELANFEDHNDSGEVWFGKSCELRIANWINSNVLKDAKICDIGCGNASLLLKLTKMNFTALYGFDYSKDAILLAQKLIESENTRNVHLEAFDVLERLPSQLHDFFDLVVDKGTFDAISLMENSDQAMKLYVLRAKQLLNPNGTGLFCITSCNWTIDELRNLFSEFFVFKEIIPSPQFSFGGKLGQTVSTVLFELNKA